MTDYEFIKEFQKIKLSNICRKYNINHSNVLNGTTTSENLKKVKNEMVKELLTLFVNDGAGDIPVLYLYNEQLRKLEKENKMLREMI